MSLFRPLDPACAEARDALSAEPSPDLTARIDAHRTRCEECRAYAAHIESVRRAVELGAGPPLDDLARARIQARLARDLDRAEAAARSHTRGAPRWRVPAYAALVAAVFLAVVALYRSEIGTRLAPRTAPVPIASKAIRPYVVAGTAALGSIAYAQLGRGVDHLEVPEGGVVRASLGERARLTVIGPAELLVLPSVAPAIELRLVRGLLLGQFEHGGEASLIVSAPDLSAKVVGTIFAVDARQTPSAVWVLEGEVAVSDRESRELAVRAGTASNDRRLRPLSGEESERLLEHRAALVPPPSSASSGVLNLSGQPEGAAVHIGAQVIGPAPLVALLSAGSAELSIAAPQHRPSVLGRSIRAGESTSIGYVLEKDEAAKPPASAAPPVPLAPRNAAPKPRTKKPLESAADRLYREAEAAMASGDHGAASTRLSELIERFPEDPLVDSARYERARLAFQAGDASAARAALDALLRAGKDPALREPARYLSCRVLPLEHRDAEELGCWRAFRESFDASAHDGEVLLRAGALAQAAGDCAAAVELFSEYLSRYPDGPGAISAEKRRAACAR